MNGPRAFEIRRRTSWALVVGLQLGCGSPPPARLGAVDPLPPEAAQDCALPYVRLDAGPALWSDLDRGTTCEVWVESDECIFGIWEDCVSLPQVRRREWQGRFRDLRAELVPAHVPSAPDRAPTRCEGVLETRREGRILRAACVLDDPSPHAGVLLEWPVAGARPWARADEAVPAPAGLTSADGDGQGGLWLGADDGSLLRYAADGQLTRTASLGRELGRIRWVRRVGNGAVVAGPRAWMRVGPDGTEGPRPLDGLTDAAWAPAGPPEGRLVGVGSLDGRGWVRNHSPATLEPLGEPRVLSGRALAVGLSKDRAVVLTEGRVVELDVSGSAPRFVRDTPRVAGPATRLAQLGSDSFGFGGPCHPAGPSHCAFRVRLPLGPVERFPVPGAGRALAPRPDGRGGLVLAGRTGLALAADGGGRPLTITGFESRDTAPWLDLVPLGGGRFAAVSADGILPFGASAR